MIDHWTNRGGSVLVTTLALFMMFAAISATGCQPADWDDPKYVADRLETGTETDRAIALDRLDRLSDKQLASKPIVNALTKVYLEGESMVNRESAMERLVQIKDLGAKEAYLKEVETNDTDFDGAAAEVLGEQGVSEAVPTFLKIFKETDNPDRKRSMLLGMQHVPSAEMIDPLVETLHLDVDNNPIALHAYSCEILGDIAQKTPEAFDEKARQALVRGMFLSAQTGQSVVQDCSMAIQKLGDPMIPELVEVHNQKSQSVSELLLKYNEGPNFSFPQNHMKMMAAQRLTTLRAKEAVDLFMEDLDAEKKAPEDLPPKQSVAWRQKEGHATSEMIRGLGDLRAEKARDLLEEIFKGEYTREDWSDITDWSVTLQLRQDAASALQHIGNRESLDVLLDMAINGVIIDLERRAAILEKKEDMDPMDPVQRYQFNWMSAKEYANLAGPGDKKPYQEMISSFEEQGISKPVIEKMKTFLPKFKVADQCLTKDGADSKADCLEEMLNSDNEQVREKAAWEMTRLPKEVAGSVLVENLSTTDLNAREILEFGLYDFPKKAAIDKINSLIEKESGKTSDKFDRDRTRLRMLRAYLKNHTAS